MTRPVPEGYQAVTPWILARGAAKLIPFLERAFGAKESEGRFTNQDGSIGHTEIRIDGATVMLFDVPPDAPPTPSFLRLFVADCDAVYRRAIEAGAVSVTEPTDLAFGDRVGRVRDPQGNVWWIQTHREDVAPDVMKQRFTEKLWQDRMTYVEQTLRAELARHR
jgi:PhnB protein